MTDVLRYAAAMLGELRTASLGPQKYYELYMQASDQLLFLTARRWRGSGGWLEKKGGPGGGLRGDGAAGPTTGPERRAGAEERWAALPRS